MFNLEISGVYWRFPPSPEIENSFDFKAKSSKSALNSKESVKLNIRLVIYPFRRRSLRNSKKCRISLTNLSSPNSILGIKNIASSAAKEVKTSGILFVGLPFTKEDIL